MLSPLPLVLLLLSPSRVTAGSPGPLLLCMPGHCRGFAATIHSTARPETSPDAASPLPACPPAGGGHRTAPGLAARCRAAAGGQRFVRGKGSTAAEGRGYEPHLSAPPTDRLLGDCAGGGWPHLQCGCTRAWQRQRQQNDLKWSPLSASTNCSVELKLGCCDCAAVAAELAGLLGSGGAQPCTA